MSVSSESDSINDEAWSARAAAEAPSQELSSEPGAAGGPLGSASAQPLPPQGDNKIRVAFAIGGVAVIFLAGMAVGAAITSPTGGDRSDQAEKVEEPPFTAAKVKCAPGSAYARVGDGGNSLTVSGQGEEDLGLPITAVSCFLTELRAPDSVVAEMDSTRALDGRQSGQWGNIRASWSYHPDQGIEIIFTLAA